MSLGNTVLGNEVKYVVEKPDPLGSYTYLIQIETPKGITKGLKLLNIDIVEDYANAFASVVTVEFFLGLGTYAKDIYPNREELKATLIRVNNHDMSDQRFETFKAILLTDANPTVDEKELQTVSKDVLDISSIVPVVLQLENVAIEQLRMISLGGVYRQCSVKDVLRNSLTTAIDQIDVDDDFTINGVDVYTSANEEVYEQIVIPHGTMLSDIPDYLQKKQFGVFSTGLGHFFMRDYWFVYPLYDTTRFNDSGHTLNISLVPKSLMAAVDRTYRTEGNTTMILCAGDRQTNNEVDKARSDKGEGTRFADASNLFTKWYDTESEENKAIANRGGNVTEVTMEDGQELTNARMSSTPITSNTFNAVSELAARKGTYFTCVWNYSNPDLLFPSQMARVKYMDGEVLRMFEGSLIGVMHHTELLGGKFTSSTYATSTSMTFFVERDLDLLDPLDEVF